jgi:hypothetical protein
MNVRKIATGQMWKNESTGEVFVVTSVYKDVLASFALLRPANDMVSSQSKRAKVIKSTEGETLAGYVVAENV